jgi:2-dehydro-3-deoxyphosphogluconate aldolase/(4S)-4-hydroxy-2-oxoglutarate aldolase
MKAANLFSGLFGFPVKDGGSSVFAGESIELVKTSAAGTHGHIAVKTNSLSRAAACLERSGLVLDYENAKKDPKGNITAIYLKEEILGFALHLLQSK